MRRIFPAALLLSCALANACGGGSQGGASNNARPAAQANSAPKETTANSSSSNSSGEVGAAPSHGGSAKANASPGTSTGAAGSDEKAPASTPELDANVQKAEAKVKAGGLSESDKKAAAGAYFARADHYRDQGMPKLYKFALADYRRGLRLDPSNSEAREKMDEIVQIYKSLGRPVPELGNEQ